MRSEKIRAKRDTIERLELECGSGIRVKESVPLAKTTRAIEDDGQMKLQFSETYGELRFAGY